MNEKNILVNPNTRVCGWGELAFLGGGGELAEKMVEDFFKSTESKIRTNTTRQG